MRVPGDAVLDFELSPDGMGQPARRDTPGANRTIPATGLAGPGWYWYAVLPFHGPVFDGLLKGIAESATMRPMDVATSRRASPDQLSKHPDAELIVRVSP